MQSHRRPPLAGPIVAAPRRRRATGRLGPWAGWLSRPAFNIKIYNEHAEAESGLFVSSINLPVSDAVEPSANRILPTPPIAMKELNQALGLDGIDPQYIATFGTISCDMAFPCLAFHQGSSSYILYHRELWEVSPRGPHLTRGKEVGTLDKNREELDKLTSDEPLVSLGGVHWTVARKVSAARVRHGLSAFP
jgi:hypothetical protein